MTLVDEFCEWVSLHLTALRSLKWKGAKFSRLNFFFFGDVDRTWNIAWIDQPQDSISLRFIPTMWTGLILGVVI